ncbi:MAG: VWA domain-containing protein [Gammaproteobacteria bacterium]
MIEQFHFLRPWWLLLLIPLAWVLWRYWRLRRQSGSWQAVCDPHLLTHLLMDGQSPASRTPILLLGIAGLLAILALAGPTWSKLPQPVYRNTAATVVLFNLSESMNAPDVTPTRLERAKLKLLDFLRRQREGQTALIAYAGEAYVVSPLTDDAATIESLVNALAPNIMPVGGTNLAQALNKAEALLEQDGVYKGGRILLITDSSGGARALKQVAAMQRKGRVLSVLAVGTRQGAPIKAPGGGFVQASDGSILIPRLNLNALHKLAAAGHGHLVGLTTTDADLNALWPSAQASRINSRQPDHNHAADSWREQGPWLLLLVLPLVALSWRQGWLALLVVTVMLQPHPAQAASWRNLWSRPDQQAYHALQQGNAKAAARLFRNRNWRSIAQYRAGNYAAAAAGFAGQHSPDALYNAGNALAHLGKLQQAAENYRKVLQQQPDNQDARHNLKIVEKLLKQRRKKPTHSGQNQQDKKHGQQHGKSASKHSKQGRQSQAHSGQGHNGQSAQHGKTGQSKTAKQQPRASRSAKAHQHNTGTRPQNANTGATKSRQQHATRPAQEKAASAKQGKNQVGQQARKGQKHNPSTGYNRNQSTEKKESAQALKQWLRRIPDDPGGLLRRKFQYLHELREQAANNGN